MTAPTEEELVQASVAWANARGSLEVFKAEHGPEDRITVEAARAEHEASLKLRDVVGRFIIERFKK